MCGRFALYSSYPRLSQALRLSLSQPDLELVPRYNVAPGTWITGVWHQGPDTGPAFGQLWWGYRPAWAKEGAPQPINAKVETVATSRFFQAAFRRHRCLIPADGWFEWLPTEDGKQPYYLSRRDREPLFLAGIWAERIDGSPGCAILTEPARGAAREIHDRMPLALNEASLEPWLDPDLTDRETIRQVVRHLDAVHIEHWPVSRAVNKPGEGQGAVLINPA
ncbi:SOS response-associated peptidase [Marinobacter sp. TBZ242]|uniref:Abasic site processing protein n=1 Tax=Marinobacter azerbaijanicus TaxID=3050455 RepID=A0ABT7II21_9GAMM|nr:SOS response-associated peptidase [Marinobacter sp. TBZ242]MDL0433817.1 SOS response-associated peptidase [Marinobacter sp. TBZ242]